MGKAKCKDCEFEMRLKRRENSRPPNPKPRKKKIVTDLVCKQCGVERDNGHYQVFHNIFPFEFISSKCCCFGVLPFSLALCVAMSRRVMDSKTVVTATDKFDTLMGQISESVVSLQYQLNCLQVQ